MDSATLSAELTTDPLRLGYATANGDAAIAELLNAPSPASRAEVLFGPGTVITVADVSRAEGRST